MNEGNRLRDVFLVFFPGVMDIMLQKLVGKGQGNRMPVEFLSGDGTHLNFDSVPLHDDVQVPVFRGPAGHDRFFLYGIAASFDDPVKQILAYAAHGR